jgi:hypothetical protein
MRRKKKTWSGVMATFLLVVTAAFSGAHAQFTTNFTADELAYVTAVGAGVREVMDSTTLSGLGSGSNKWWGITFADNVGKLYAAPRNAEAVLIIDPLNNNTDITTLVGLGTAVDKWIGITYAANVGKLYAAPTNTAAVLIIDPLTNTTDISTLAGLGSGANKWRGITYAANVGKLYAAPFLAAAVLIVDPLTNTTDITTLAGLGSSAALASGKASRMQPTWASCTQRRTT